MDKIHHVKSFIKNYKELILVNRQDTSCNRVSFNTLNFIILDIEEGHKALYCGRPILLTQGPEPLRHVLL